VRERIQLISFEPAGVRRQQSAYNPCWQDAVIEKKCCVSPEDDNLSALSSFIANRQMHIINYTRFIREDATYCKKTEPNRGRGRRPHSLGILLRFY